MVLSQNRTEDFKSKPTLKDHLLSKICHTFTLLTLHTFVCDTMLRCCKTLHFFPSVDVFVTSLRSCKTPLLCGCVCDVLRSCKTLHLCGCVCDVLRSCKTPHLCGCVCDVLRSCKTPHLCGCVCDVLRSCKTLHFLPSVDVFLTS